MLKSISWWPVWIAIMYSPLSWSMSCEVNLTQVDLKHPVAIHFQKQAYDVAQKIEKAPKEVLDLLSLAPHTSFLGPASRAHLLKVFAGTSALAELEIVIGQELDSLLPRLSTIFALQNMASPEALEWFRSLNSTQYFILAAALNTVPKARALTASRDSLKGMQTLSALSRWGIPPHASLFSVLRDNPYMTMNGIQSALIADQRLKRLNRSINRITAADEDMVEWIAEQLLSATEPLDVPLEWREKLRRTRQILNTPLQDQAKYKGSVNFGTLVQYELFENLYHEVLDKWRELERLPPDGQMKVEVSELVRSFLTIAFADRLLTPGSGATLAMMTLFSLQLQFPLGNEIGRIVPIRIREQMNAGLKEYYNSFDIGPNNESPLPVESENLSRVAQDLYPTEPEQIPPAENSDLLVSSAELSFDDLSAGIPITVTFKRVKSRFQGPQQVVFTEAALNGIRERITKEVDPQTWMNALQMGIAADHGQRGIKILNQGQPRNGKGIAIELKLLLSPWRVIGHYANGIFVFETLKNNHR